MSQGSARQGSAVGYASRGDILLSGLTMNANKLLGRTTTGVGALEEIEYSAGSFTPTFTFATPGNLSVAYHTQLGSYVRFGSIVFIKYELIFTPTHTTASGDAIFGGLPFTASAVGGQYGPGLLLNAGGATFPAGTTDLFCQIVASTTTARLRSQGSAATVATWGVSQFPTAAVRNVQTQMFYIAA